MNLILYIPLTMHFEAKVVQRLCAGVTHQLNICLTSVPNVILPNLQNNLLLQNKAKLFTYRFKL